MPLPQREKKKSKHWPKINLVDIFRSRFVPKEIFVRMVWGRGLGERDLFCFVFLKVTIFWHWHLDW